MKQRQQFEEEESTTPYVREGGRFMEDVPGHGSAARRNEDIALDMMKFIAMTTGYGKTGTPGAGFQGGPPAKPTEYAEHLLELYGRCLGAVQGKK